MSQSGTGDIEERIAGLEQQNQQLARALELLERRDTAPSRKARRDWNGYAAVIASFIGVLALAISGYTAYVQRQQLRAQVWPRLELAYSDVELTIFVTNQGTGPARVKAMRVTVDGAPMKTWSDVRKAAGFAGDEGLVTSWLRQRVLSSGKDTVILKPRNEQSQAKFRELLPGGRHAISMMICYCSVLDECWSVSSGDTRDDGKPPPSDACSLPAAERFTE